MRSLPFSLLFFLLTGLLFLLQLFPGIGIVLMLFGAAFWSAILINCGMIGIVAEVWKRRVPHAWLILPLSFYGGYYTFAAIDYWSLHSLRRAADTANSAVSIPFAPSRQALVINGGGEGPVLIQNFALPVVYSSTSHTNAAYHSNRLVKTETCHAIRDLPAARAAGIMLSGFHNGDETGDRELETRFCILTMPETPSLPLVTVTQDQKEARKGFMPVSVITTTVTMSNGRRFELRGGSAAPLRTFPLPVMGCALNSSNPSWDCNIGFMRAGFTPIVSGDTRYTRDSIALARALGLKPVTPATRQQAAVPDAILARIADIERKAVEQQLAAVDVMIADPFAEASWDTDVLAKTPEILVTRASGIMRGLERAAAVEGDARFKVRDTGHILAQLLAALPPEQFSALAPRILAAYDGADDLNLLWQSESLIRRLGDLGPAALPLLTRPRAIRASNNAIVESLCRVGTPAREAGRPILLAIWNDPENASRQDRAPIYVALRRIGVSPPPPAQDRQNFYANLQRDLVMITPSSPASVCHRNAITFGRRGKLEVDQRYS